MKRSLALIILMLLFSSPAFATVLQAMSVEEMSLSAEAIVRGVVTDVSAFKDPKTERIYTLNTVSVTERIKGQSPDSVVVRQIGGTYQGMTVQVPGTPRFEVGEQVVLFLTKEGSLHFLRGMGQGGFSIVKDNGVEMAKQKLAGASLFKQNKTTGEKQVVHETGLNIPVKDLMTRIQAALKKK